MVAAKELYKKGLQRLEKFSIKGALPALRFANEGAIEDVLNTNGCAYYQWLPCLIDEVKPKQIIELGGAMGVSSIMMCQANHQDFKLYSITLPEHGLEFSYVQDNYPQLVKIVGDDLDLNYWPEDLELHDTDIWFFDSEHSRHQLVAELELYSPFFKPGAILLFDDIHVNAGLDAVWEDIKNGKCGKWDSCDATSPLHYSGFGIVVT